MRRKGYVLIVLILCCIGSVHAQRKVIQFSGLVVGGDSLYGIPGAAVYVPKAGRGTITNEYGFFSIPVLVGDSVVLSSLGYKRKGFIIPPSKDDKITIVLELMVDTILFPEVQVFPYPTEESFRRAFMDLNARNHQQVAALKRNFDPELIDKITLTTGMSGYENQTYTLQQQSYTQANKFLAPAGYIPLLSPFAWANFIRSVRRGDLKKYKKNKEKYEQD